MLFDWDDDKNRSNLADHGISFEVASLVFDDPLAQNVPDPFEDEERWRTTGTIGGTVIVLVVHTWSEVRIVNEEDGAEETEEVVRLISARKATKGERESYEESIRRQEWF